MSNNDCDLLKGTTDFHLADYFLLEADPDDRPCLAVTDRLPVIKTPLSPSECGMFHFFFLASEWQADSCHFAHAGRGGWRSEGHLAASWKRPVEAS
jgi:hypothetical protein